jgi:hypothetical protein
MSPDLLHMAITVLRSAGVVVCMAVLLACAARITMLHPRENRHRYFIAYLAGAGWAAFMLLQLLRGDRISITAAVLLGLWFVYVIATHQRWRHGPPPEAFTRHRSNGGIHGHH